MEVLVAIAATILALGVFIPIAALRIAKASAYGWRLGNRQFENDFPNPTEHVSHGDEQTPQA